MPSAPAVQPSTVQALPAEAPLDCARCPRLHAFRNANAEAEPDWFNAPVPSFGPETAQLLIVGLAPGLKGANRTGRPFTGDYAGDLLYATLATFGFSNGSYQARSDDGLALTDTMITNAVRCVPPQNKPTPQEIRNCRPYFVGRIRALPNLKVVLALGRIAHDQILAAADLKKADFPFAHGAIHDITARSALATTRGGIHLVDSFHCSRYNTNTGRLTPEMFRSVFSTIRTLIDSPSSLAGRNQGPVSEPS